MNALRAVLITDAAPRPQSAAQVAAQSALARHAWVDVGMTICLQDWLDGPMRLSPDQGDLAVVALTDIDAQLPKLALQSYSRPFPISTVVTADPCTVFIVGATHDGPFAGSQWVDASSVGIASAIEHAVAPDLGLGDPRTVASVMAHSSVDDISLSPKQAVILFLLTSGLSAHQSGQLLHISEKTISSHKRRIMDKLGITNFPDLVRVADQNRAGLMAVSESWLGEALEVMMHQRLSRRAFTRLKLKRG